MLYIYIYRHTHIVSIYKHYVIDTHDVIVTKLHVTSISISGVGQPDMYGVFDPQTTLNISTSNNSGIWWEYVLRIVNFQKTYDHHFYGYMIEWDIWDIWDNPQAGVLQVCPEMGNFARSLINIWILRNPVFEATASVWDQFSGEATTQQLGRECWTDGQKGWPKGQKLGSFMQELVGLLFLWHVSMDI